MLCMLPWHWTRPCVLKRAFFITLLYSTLAERKHKIQTITEFAVLLIGLAAAALPEWLNSIFYFYSTILLQSFVKEHLLPEHQVQTKSRGGCGAWIARGHDPIRASPDSKWCMLTVTWRRHRCDRTITDALSSRVREELLTAIFSPRSPSEMFPAWRASP